MMFAPARIIFISIQINLLTPINPYSGEMNGYSILAIQISFNSLFGILLHTYGVFW